MKKIVIFTDLDGTLLDAHNYSFTAAREAVNILIKRKIPIIPCTSKTHLEVEQVQKKIGISDPFIVENGSAIFFNQGYFSNKQPKLTNMNGHKVLVLGSKYSDILKFFNIWRSHHKLSITGFHEMQVEKVMELTDLNYDEAELAKKRFFSEPFIVNNDKILPPASIEDILKNGFRLLHGNRFYHLLGNSDKGTAVKKISEMFKQKWNVDKLISIGIGDSMNDLEMLKSVDKPVLVKKSGGYHQTGIEIDNLLCTYGIGPAGWQEAIFRFLEIL